MKYKIAVVRLLFFLLTILTSYVAYATGTQEDKHKLQKPRITVGVSLPDQRSARWVNIKRHMERYAEELPVSLELRFSDNDMYLQAHQINSLIRLDISILAFAAPPQTRYNEELLEVLQLAKSKGIFVIAFDLFLPYTDDVDLFISYEFENFDRSEQSSYTPIQTVINTHFFKNTKTLVDIDTLKQVVDGDLQYMHYYNARILVKEVLDSAVYFSNKKLKPRNYRQISSVTKSISAVFLEPTIITKDNYRAELIETEVVAQSALD